MGPSIQRRIAQRRRTGQQGPWIGQPITVVRITDIVGPHHPRRSGRRINAGRRTRILPPAATAARTVEQQRRLQQQATVDEFVGVHVRHDAGVRIQRIAFAVGRDRIHPRQAHHPVQRILERAHAAGGTDAEPLLEHARIAAVRVGQHIGGLRRPRHARCRPADDGALVAEIKGLAAPANQSVRQQRIDVDRLRRHPAPLAVIYIRGAAGVGGVQRQPEGGEVIGKRHRVTPRNVAIEADHDGRDAADDHAHRVIAPRHGQVSLVETVGRGPGIVRVTQQQPTAIGGQVLAHRQRIAAETLLVELIQLRHQ